jgi:hypothetical protein
VSSGNTYFCLMEISWDRGLYLDILSVRSGDNVDSFFCLYLGLDGLYLELFGLVLFDTLTELTDDEESRQD